METDCEDIVNKSNCLDAGCYWYHCLCNSKPGFDCESYSERQECLGHRCFWNGESCQTDRPVKNCDMQITGCTITPECEVGVDNYGQCFGTIIGTKCGYDNPAAGIMYVSGPTDYIYLGGSIVPKGTIRFLYLMGCWPNLTNVGGLPIHQRYYLPGNYTLSCVAGSYDYIHDVFKIDREQRKTVVVTGDPTL